MVAADPVNILCSPFCAFTQRLQTPRKPFNFMGTTQTYFWVGHNHRLRLIGLQQVHVCYICTWLYCIMFIYTNLLSNWLMWAIVCIWETTILLTHNKSNNHNKCSNLITSHLVMTKTGTSINCDPYCQLWTHNIYCSFISINFNLFRILCNRAMSWPRNCWSTACLVSRIHHLFDHPIVWPNAQTHNIRWVYAAGLREFLMSYLVCYVTAS